MLFRNIMACEEIMLLWEVVALSLLELSLSSVHGSGATITPRRAFFKTLTTRLLIGLKPFSPELLAPVLSVEPRPLTDFCIED